MADTDAPLVSVVIPTYGRPELVTGAVETVREQTYESIELVLVDDCSPEPIEPRIREMDLDTFEDVRVLRHDDNQGAAAARATGIEAATGEFIAFLDDDDRWAPEKLRTQVEAIRVWGENAGVAYTGMRYVDADGETKREHVPTESGDLTKTLLCRNVVGSYSTVLVRAEAIEEVGLPDSRFPSWQDMEWYVRLSPRTGRSSPSTNR
ncbi:glycosyltransferase family 2 protein [Natronomonas salina]|uniref:glycosyltransferase family 2 protein n=1 Tax=Natronomonas salina TaxID=1710540 RepID=UPI0015B5C205|nr:glycosyltransferase family 2 protein [Natronomonas salina]QLD90782.1 glycosyltransferase family 2 protein [Natronomonas salina]